MATLYSCFGTSVVLLSISVLCWIIEIHNYLPCIQLASLQPQEQSSRSEIYFEITLDSIAPNQSDADDIPLIKMRCCLYRMKLLYYERSNVDKVLHTFPTKYLYKIKRELPELAFISPI